VMKTGQFTRIIDEPRKKEQPDDEVTAVLDDDND
jgi:hypothetical protein